MVGKLHIYVSLQEDVCMCVYIYSVTCIIMSPSTIILLYLLPLDPVTNGCIFLSSRVDWAGHVAFTHVQTQTLSTSIGCDSVPSLFVEHLGISPLFSDFLEILDICFSFFLFRFPNILGHSQPCGFV